MQAKRYVRRLARELDRVVGEVVRQVNDESNQQGIEVGVELDMRVRLSRCKPTPPLSDPKFLKACGIKRFTFKQRR